MCDLGAKTNNLDTQIYDVGSQIHDLATEIWARGPVDLIFDQIELRATVELNLTIYK